MPQAAGPDLGMDPDGVAARRAQILGQRAGDESADLGPEGFLLGAVLQIHAQPCRSGELPKAHKGLKSTGNAK